MMQGKESRVSGSADKADNELERTAVKGNDMPFQIFLWNVPKPTTKMPRLLPSRSVIASVLTADTWNFCDSF